MLRAFEVFLDFLAKARWALLVLVVLGLAYFVGAPKDMGILEWARSLLQGLAQ